MQTLSLATRGLLIGGQVHTEAKCREAYRYIFCQATA